MSCGGAVIRVLLWCFFRCVDCIYIPVFIIRLFKTPRKCPPIKNDLLLIPAGKLSELIRTKEVSSVEVIKAYISRVKEVDPIINAVIEDRFEEALRDAKKADDLILKGEWNENQLKEKYPLLGVPITIKGSIAVAGLRHTAGRVDRSVRAEIDSVPVKHARDAGAIPILTSNVPELCLNWETTNKLMGTTKNPYNSTRTVGGSSGGEASLLGCGASLIGIGSDIAGSLRNPAHYCGVWGHKPTPFTVSTVGHYPDCKNKEKWNSVFTLGPLARYATDLRMLLSILIEPNKRELLKIDEEVPVRKIRIYFLKDINSILTTKVSGDVLKAIEKVVSHLDLVSAEKCTQIDLPSMKYCAELSYLSLLNVDDIDNVFKGRGEGCFVELLKFMCCRSKHEITSICYGMCRKLMNVIPQTRIRRVEREIDDLRNDLLKILGDDGVLILPTCPTEANYHRDILRKIFDPGYLSIFNVLGFPVTNCPVHFSKNGLPVGLQVVATPNLDRLSLSIAVELERAFGGWKPSNRVVDEVI